MKKVRKILLLVLALTLMFTTTAFAEESYLGQPESFYKQQIPAILESTFYGTQSTEELEYKRDNTVGYMQEAYGAYLSIYENLGDFVSSDDVTLDYHEDEEELEIACEATFEKSKLVSTVVCKVYGEDLNIKSITFSQKDLEEASFGDKMGTAAINTLIGMGTVFLVLIFISFLIYLLKFVPMLLDKKKSEPEPVAAVPAPAVTVPLEEETDDTELIAVIAAAIAASEGTTTDGFVVRSIRKRR